MEAAGFAEPSRSGTAPVGGKARPTKRRNSASPMRKSSINALLGRHSRSSKKLGRDSAASQEETDEDAVRKSIANRHSLRRRRTTKFGAELVDQRALATGGLTTISSKVHRIYRDESGRAAATFVIETLMYVVFLAIFLSGLLFARQDENEFYMRKHMEEVLLREEWDPWYTHVREDFMDIAKVQDVYAWLRGPLPRILFEEPYFARPEANVDGADWPIAGQNHLVGPVRLRQVRVKPDAACAVIEGLRAPPHSIDHCFTYRDLRTNVDTTPFGDCTNATAAAAYPGAGADASAAADAVVCNTSIPAFQYTTARVI